MYDQRNEPQAYVARPTYEYKRQCSYSQPPPMPVHPSLERPARLGQFQHYDQTDKRPYSPPTPPMDNYQQKVTLPPISSLIGLVGSTSHSQQRPRLEIPKFRSPNSDYNGTPKQRLPPTPPLAYNGIGSASTQVSTSQHLSPQPSESGRPPMREQRLSMTSEASTYSAVSATSLSSRSPGSLSTPASALSTDTPLYSNGYRTSPMYQTTSVLGKRPSPSEYQPAREVSTGIQHPRSPQSTPVSASTSPASTHRQLDAEPRQVPNSSHSASSPSSQFVPSERYTCPQCNKAFSRPSSLRIHSHSHTGEKPYKCPHKSCGKAFSVRSNMKRHEKGCHAGERDRRMEIIGGSGPSERELLPAAA